MKYRPTGSPRTSTRSVEADQMREGVSTVPLTVARMPAFSSLSRSSRLRPSVNRIAALSASTIDAGGLGHRASNAGDSQRDGVLDQPPLNGLNCASHGKSPLSRLHPTRSRVFCPRPRQGSAEQDSRSLGATGPFCDRAGRPRYFPDGASRPILWPTEQLG